MHRVIYHKRAVKALKRIPPLRANQILAAMDELAVTPDPGMHPNVKVMRGHYQGSLRMRVGDYRIIFELSPEDNSVLLILFVTDIGSRGDVY